MTERRFTVAEIVVAFESVASLHQRVADLKREVQKLREGLSPRGGMAPTEKTLFTRKEAAATLSISASTLDVAIGRGMLRARRQGRRVLIHRKEIERFARAEHWSIWPERSSGKTTRRREVPKEE
jgi:excisionase family DNA binding protein